MPTETTPETTDTTAPEDTQPAPEPDTDPATWDSERSARTIAKQRASEQGLKHEVKGLREAVQALAAGRPLTPAAQAIIDAAAAPAADSELGNYRQAFTEIASALNVTYNGSDTAPLLDAARASRLSAEAGRAIQAKGLDDRLTRAVLDLSGVDLSAGAAAISTAVAEAVDRAAFESPALRVRTQTAIVSGAPFGPGSGQSGMPGMVTREQMKYMSPTEIQQAARSGLIEGVGAHK